MRAVVQRVLRARVSVANQTVGEIQSGLVVLVGVGRDDSAQSASYLAEKIANLRIFADETGKMNRSVRETAGAVLVVSQFTLYGDTRGGRRPSYIRAAAPEQANRLYEELVRCLRSYGVPVSTGVFQAHTEVELVNDGPVTILLDSEKTL